MLSRMWIIYLCVWLTGQTCVSSLNAASNTNQPSSSTTAQPEPCPSVSPEEEKRVILQAETLEYFQATKRVVAMGNVRVTYGDKRLLADQLELHTDSNTGTAWGHVRFMTPDDDLEAARIEFDFNTERGVLYDATGKTAKIYNLSGERIERLEPRKLAVQRGRITTCTSAVPEWQFRSPDAQIDLGDYITMKHPTFWIKGIPVFYVPYFVFPIKDKRTTGFLPPRFGSNSQFGTIVGEQFFWAMTDWLDSTIGVEYLSKSGVKPEVEMRYAIDPASDGLLQASFLHDRSTNQDLYRVLVQQRQDFGWGIRGLSQLDLRSEQDLLRRFSLSLAEESAIRTASFGAVTKVFPNSGLTLEATAYEGIPNANATDNFYYLPRVRFSQFPTTLPGGLLGDLETSYARLSSTNILNNTPVQRLDFFPRLTLPLIVPPWVGLAVTGGVHETFYDHRIPGPGPISRQVPDLLAFMDGPAWRRRYDGIVPGQSLIHVIQPQIAYRYVPEVFQGGLPPFAALNEEVFFLDPFDDFTLIDRIRAANYAKISLSNRVYAQAPGPESSGSRSVREVAHLILSQGVGRQQITDANQQLTGVGPLDIDLELRLWPRWWLESTLRLAPTTGSLQEVFWRGGLNLWPGTSLILTNYQRQNPVTQYLQSSFVLTLIEGLRLTYSARYDVVTEEFRGHFLALHYQGVCYRIDASFNSRKAGPTNFFIQVNILNL
jgi:LPS-assembly protein